MGIYSSYEVYPSWFDEIEPCHDSETCEFSGRCFEAGECLKLSK